jgi:hypothetical protein
MTTSALGAKNGWRGQALLKGLFIVFVVIPVVVWVPAVALMLVTGAHLGWPVILVTVPLAVAWWPLVQWTKRQSDYD